MPSNRPSSSEQPLPRRIPASPPEIGSIYAKPEWGPAPADRPYVLLDMVSTIDGKILSGGREESVEDLGSKNDHAILWRLESYCDAVIVGANSLRASPGWNFHTDFRFTVSRTGDLDFGQPFFTQGTPFVAHPSNTPLHLPDGVRDLPMGLDSVDPARLLGKLKTEFGIKRVLLLGGSELNAQFLRADLVDEVFVTIAPKIKLGRDVPTIADGEPLGREELLRYTLVESHALQDELFVRYRRKRN